MGEINYKGIFRLLLIYVLTGIAVGLFLYFVIPNHYFSWYPAIPVFFTVFGIIMHEALGHFRKINPKMMVIAYLILRGVKLIITILGVLIYNLNVDIQNYDFSVVTVSFYFFYLILETYLYIKFEQSIKNETKN